LDTNKNVVTVETGPKTFTCLEHEKGKIRTKNKNIVKYSISFCIESG